MLGIVQQRTARRLQKARDSQQLTRIGRYRRGPARDRIAPTSRMPPKAGLPCRTIRSFASVVCCSHSSGLLVVVQRTKRAAFLLCRLRCRLSGQFFQYFVVFQCFKGIFSPNLFISNPLNYNLGIISTYCAGFR